MKLTDSKLRAIKPREGQYKVADGHGLSLLVMPNGTKTWYLRHYVEGKAKDRRLGTYPPMMLAEARRERDLFRGKAIGTPASSEVVVIDRKRLFRSVAEEWFEVKKRPILVERTATRQWARLRELIGLIGDRDIGTITEADMLAALRQIEARGVGETVHRIRGFAEHIFKFAKIPYGVTVNPATQNLLESMKAAPEPDNFPAMKFEDLPEFYRRLRGEPYRQARDDSRTRLAVELVMHTILRTNELRLGEWSQIKGNEWHLPASQMKKVNFKSYEHIVPLNARALEILAELKTWSGNSKYIFPGLGRTGRLMSENTMNQWMKGQGYKGIACPHGFRSTFSTAAYESGKWKGEWIECQLSHVHGGVAGTYNKAKYLEHRHAMMAWWGEVLADQESTGLAEELVA